MRPRMILTLLIATSAIHAGAQTLTVSLAASSVTWNTSSGNSLNPGSAANAGNRTIAVTTTWTNISPSTNGITTYAYFNSATALAHTTCIGTCPDIPASAFEVGVNGGVLKPTTQASPFSAYSVALFSPINITGLNKNGTRTDTLRFNIDLSALPQLPPDTYNGTLVIQVNLLP